MSENQNPNLISSRNHIEITNSSNPSISLRKVGSDYLVITQNNQNICIYRNQITDLKQALQEIDFVNLKTKNILNRKKTGYNPD